MPVTPNVTGRIRDYFGAVPEMTGASLCPPALEVGPAEGGTPFVAGAAAPADDSLGGARRARGAYDNTFTALP